MSGMSGWMLVAAGVVIVLNLAATARVLRAFAFSPSQQLVQLMLIWLLPVMGATICIAFARSQAIGDTRERDRLDPYAGSDGGSGDGNPAFFDSGACDSAFGGDGCGGGDGGGGD